MNWCRVVERAATRGSDECVSGTLTAHRSTVRLLRRFFEGLRPPAFRRLPGQHDGEELDVDAVVEGRPSNGQGSKAATESMSDMKKKNAT